MRAVLLDLDGTLTEPGEGITRCLRHALEGLDAPSPPRAALLGWIGAPLQEVFAALLPQPHDARIEAAIGLYRERFADVGWRENRVHAQIPELLRALRARGLRLAIATSKPTVFAERIAHHFGLHDDLDAVYGSELDGSRSAKPDLLAHLLERESLRAQDAVMVGDRHHDVAGARAVGAATIGVTWGYGSRDELERAGADQICDAPLDVVGAVEALANP